MTTVGASSPATAEDIVVVIDQDAATLKALSRLGKAHGFRAVTLADYLEIQWHMRTDGLRCVVVDARSFATCQTALASEPLADVPKLIVGIPRYLEALDELFGAINGRLIEKPFTLVSILDAILVAFDSCRAGASNRRDRHEIDRLFDSLTYREWEVGSLVASGLSNQEISERLGISVRTVKAHRAKVMEKTCSDSLAAYVGKYHQHAAGGGRKP